MVVRAKPDLTYLYIPTNKYRLMLYEAVNSTKFDIIIMICILCNIITMALNYEGESNLYSYVLETINLFFTVVFICSEF